MEALGKTPHKWEGRRLSEREVSESNPLSLIQRCLDFAPPDNDYNGLFVGNVGRIFATATKPSPIAIRKNEKNWPRVK